MKISDLKKRFKTEEAFVKMLELALWVKEPICPYCNASYYTPIPDNRYKCNKCNSSFSVTVGTIFHKTRFDLRKWYAAIDFVYQGNDKSVRELGEEWSVTKDTALRMIKGARKLQRENELGTI